MTGKEICKNRYDKTKALKYVNRCSDHSLFSHIYKLNIR